MIEVMICLIIAGLVFGTAYTTARKSSAAITTARERVFATKLAETQAELLKSGDINQSGNFCLETSTATLGLVKTAGFGAGTPHDNPALDGAYPTECKSNTIYRIGIRSTGTKTYRIFVRWDALGGGINQVQLNYGLQ